MPTLEEKNARIDGNSLIVEFNPESKTLSKSGKTLLLSSSGGFIWDGDLGISWNIIRKKAD